MLYRNAAAHMASISRKGSGNRKGHSLLETLAGSIGHYIRRVLIFIRTLSAKRLQIESLELGIRYSPGISEKLPKSLGRPFAVKISAKKHLFLHPPFFSLTVHQFHDQLKQTDLCPLKSGFVLEPPYVESVASHCNNRSARSIALLRFWTA
jgi:hypothetical protein